MFKIFPTLSVILLCLAYTESFRPTLVLFQENDCVGDGLYVYDAIPHLEDFGYNASTRFQSAIHFGAFVFYAEPNFDRDESGRVKPVSSWMICFNPEESCSERLVPLFPIGSVRPVGSKTNFYRPSISFYEQVDFRGTEQYIDTNSPALSINVTSLIMVGSSEWTVFTERNYTGDAICITDDELHKVHPVAIADILEILGVNAIKSAWKGCDDMARTVNLPKSVYDPVQLDAGFKGN